jgi:hypothetical protein
MTAFLDLDEQQIQDLSPEKKYDYERLEMIKRTYGQLIPDAEVRKWSPEKIKKIDLETLYKLTKKQIENLTTRQWEAMTEKAKDDIKFKQYNYHLVWKKRRHLGDSLLINKELEDAVSSWSPATIASLPVEKLKWLNLHYIVTVMTTEQLQALAENINYVHFLRHRRDEMERERPAIQYFSNDTVSAWNLKYIITHLDDFVLIDGPQFGIVETRFFQEMQQPENLKLTLWWALGLDLADSW